MKKISESLTIIISSTTKNRPVCLSYLISLLREIWHLAGFVFDECYVRQVESKANISDTESNPLRVYMYQMKIA